MELKLDAGKTYAIALEGGGAKGAYQIGAWKALDEAGIRYNAVSGTSVGSLNGAMMAMRDLDRAVKFWQNLRFSEVMNVDDNLMQRLFDHDFKGLDMRGLFRTAVDTVKQGGFDVEPLRALLREAIDEKAVRASDVAFFLMTYSVTDRKELDVDVKALPEGELYDMLLASAYFPAFKHEKLGGKMYTDGGVQDVVPIHSLTSRGYKDLIVMRIYGVGMERRFRIPQDVHITTIAPTQDLGNVLNFSSEQSRYDMKLGYYDAQRVLYGLYGSAYYIDRTLDEQAAYDRLCAMARYREPGVSLRQLNEASLPALSKLADAGKADYYGVFAAAMDKAAAALGIDPFAVVTDVALYDAVCKKAAAVQREKRDAIVRYFPAE